MIICPNCQSENRSGAKFCRNCAKPLPESPAATRPLDDGVARSKRATIRLNTEPNPKAQNPSGHSRTDTRPLPASQTLTSRPMGAIFGDVFLQKSLVFSDEQRSQYLVSHQPLSEEARILACPNPTCGAYFPPRMEAAEKFCTDCGTVLAPGGQNLTLVETLTPIPKNIAQIVVKGLSHASVRAPLAAFEEQLARSRRNCLVMPEVGMLEGRPESKQALAWGIELGRGLDYLHDNGISFGGAIDASCFALAGERAMWANFTRAHLHPQGFVSERLQDTRALAFLVFHWLTGKNQYEHDPTLLPKVSQALDQALSGPGFASGGELAQALEQALAETSVAHAVDYHVGRRTDVGMVRTLNEDSMLTMEIERFLQSVGQPVGVYVVADGMGGHTAGEIASGAIVNTIAQKALKEHMLQQVTQGVSQDASEWLRSAVEEANKTVFELRKSAGTDMGSTLVSAVLQGNMAYIAHVGDSRAYMLNSQGIRQLTTDHSLVERLIATNQITREEARHHPQRNVIYRTIGDKMKVDVDISTHALSPGDQLLLCSDGLSGMVDDQTIYRIVSKADSPQSACEALIDAANAAGGDDNITIIIIRIIRA